MYMFLIIPTRNQNDKNVFVELMTGYKLSLFHSVINTKSTALMHGQ